MEMLTIYCDRHDPQQLLTAWPLNVIRQTAADPHDARALSALGGVQILVDGELFMRGGVPREAQSVEDLREMMARSPRTSVERELQLQRSGRIRGRLNLRCHLCRTTVLVKDWGTFAAKLDLCSQAGVSQLSLRGLERLRLT